MRRKRMGEQVGQEAGNSSPVVSFVHDAHQATTEAIGLLANVAEELAALGVGQNDSLSAPTQNIRAALRALEAVKKAIGALLEKT